MAEQEGEKTDGMFHVAVSGSLNFEDESGDALLVRVQAPGKEEKILAYAPTTSSGTVTQDAAVVSGILPTPDLFEIITEEVERSKGWGTGIIGKIEIPDYFSFSVEKNPWKETRTLPKVIYRKPNP